MTELKKTTVTFGILIITTLVFMAIQIFRFGDSTSGATIFEFGGLYGLYLQYDPSQLWRLITPIFVHIGWQHFLFNLFAILYRWSVGRASMGLLALSPSLSPIRYHGQCLHPLPNTRCGGSRGLNGSLWGFCFHSCSGLFWTQSLSQADGPVLPSPHCGQLDFQPLHAQCRHRRAYRRTGWRALGSGLSAHPAWNSVFRAWQRLLAGGIYVLLALSMILLAL